MRTGGERGMEWTAVSNGYKMFKLEDERWEFVMQLCLPLPNGFVNDFFSKIKTEAKSQDELWPMR